MGETVRCYYFEWYAYYVEQLIRTSSGYKVKYSFQINDEAPIPIKPGIILNDFLCLCKYTLSTIEIFESRTKKWVNKYIYPFVSDQEQEIIQEDNRDIFYEIDGRLVPSGPSTRKGPVKKLIHPYYDVERYLNAIKANFCLITNCLLYEQSCLPPLEVAMTGKGDNAYRNTIYTFEKDIIPLLMLDLYKVAGRYQLNICPYCRAPFLPINGRTRCAGCKPGSKLSKKELEASGIETENVSNNNERTARIKQLRRQGKTAFDINRILKDEGFKPVRRYRKAER